MGTLVRFSNYVSRTSIGAMIVCTIAVYVFHLGEWTFLGTRIYSILVFSAMVALLNALIQDLVLYPALSGQVAALAKQAIMLSDDGNATAGQVSFAKEVIDAMDKREKTLCRLGAVVGLVCYFVLGPRIGSPVSEYVSLALLIFLPTLLLFAKSGQLSRMEALEPSIYDIAGRLYSSIHMAITNGTMR